MTLNKKIVRTIDNCDVVLRLVRWAATSRIWDNALGLYFILNEIGFLSL